MDLQAEIRRRIVERGPIPFVEFMDLALYWPDGGYYSSPDVIGARGDFYTAPTAHPAFGALLSLQVCQMWRILDEPSRFWVVEMGAGGGLLCHDLMAYSSHLPQEFRSSLRYLCVDRLGRTGAEDNLPTEARRAVSRLVANGAPLAGITGCFLSNELLDSLPVHRVTVRDGAFQEIYVTLEENRFVEVLGPPSTPALERRLGSLGVTLAEGSIAEINLAMEPWLEEVSQALQRGFLLTVDYGDLAAELYSPRRRRGTLSCFHGHTQTDDPYRRVGAQDMTSHVDFTTLVEAGKARGQEPLGGCTQGEFLGNLGLTKLMGRLMRMGLGQRETDANRMGMLDIARSGGMGDFKVLAQGKGVGQLPPLWGFTPSRELEEVLETLPVPLLSPLHAPLLEGRYPHLTQGWDDLWPGESGEAAH